MISCRRSSSAMRASARLRASTGSPESDSSSATSVERRASYAARSKLARSRSACSSSAPRRNRRAAERSATAPRKWSINLARTCESRTSPLLASAAMSVRLMFSPSRAILRRCSATWLAIQATSSRRSPAVAERSATVHWRVASIRAARCSHASHFGLPFRSFALSRQHLPARSFASSVERSTSKASRSIILSRHFISASAAVEASIRGSK
mmetsp:Transcript_16606/g.50500  ORF Transcript_16606/g.50500 Transcript_16606/m.50500 type:complete len:211 (+) Transcript_16606:1461-2093(+)